MKKKSAIIIGIICLVICVSIIAVLAMKNGSNQYLTNDKGEVIEDSYGNRYLDYQGEPGKTDEQTGNNGKKTYYVSGVWQWNSILVFPEGMEDGTTELATLKFQTARQTHTKILYLQETINNIHYAALYYSSSESNSVHQFRFGWSNSTDRLVDFGTEPQLVSETFYRFLTENAVPATREDYMDVVTDYVESVEKVTISGYWKWNETISPKTMTNNAMYIRIKGTLANRKVAYMYYFSNGVNNGKLELNFAAKEDSIPNFCAWMSTRATPWDNDKERYIYLGDEEQTITQSEYQFFVANATPCTKEEYDSMVAKDGRETTWGSTEYTGKHLWTEYVPWKDKSNAGNDWGEDTISFTSNGKEYTILRGQYDPETKVHTIFYGTADEMTAVYSTQTGWVDEVYRTIIFKEGTIVHIETLNQVQNYCKPVSQ